jgi:DNA-binding response OmpR family regulator
MSHKIIEEDKTIEYNGEKYIVTRMEFELFRYLFNNKDRVISREELMREVWKYDNHVGSNRTIDVHILRLRKIIPDCPIVTRKCFGYMFKSN